MCGDVMTGRGIDQILPHPVDPRLYEGFVTDARRYVDLAERVNGPIPRPAPFDYIWGDALHVLNAFQPDLRVINLETSVTTSDSDWPGKGINYRMHPANFPCITAAGIDVCALANNHVIDWDYQGLRETLQTAEEAGVKVAGAGRDAASAATQATVDITGKGRVHVFSFGHPSSGIPVEWQAVGDRPGVNLLRDFSEQTVREIAAQVGRVKRGGDLALASIHWGGNWGFEVPEEQIDFAHGLIDVAGIDIVHGHSSHHVKAIEIYRGKPVLYGCGDFLNDYEGISGYRQFRGELSFMYFTDSDAATGELRRLRLVPTRVRNFRVGRADEGEARWLIDTMNWEGKRFGTWVEEGEEGILHLRWD